MVFSRCSSAGVHGVFVRLFFAGGPIEDEPDALISWPPIIPGTPPDGPDIVNASAPPVPKAVLLFRTVGEKKGSALAEGSSVVECARRGEIPEFGRIGGLSTRLDIFGNGRHENAMIIS